jgi:hypothetical protein
MLSRVVKGDGITPLYKFLTDKKTNPKFGGDIRWNFTKFLVSNDGEIIGRFEPRVDPLSDGSSAPSSELLRSNPASSVPRTPPRAIFLKNPSLARRAAH